MKYLIALGIVFLIVFVPAVITLYIKSRQEKAKLKPREEEKKIELPGLFEWIRKYAAVPILYAILVGFLWYIEWTREIIKQNFGLVLIAVIAIALTPLLLEYKQKPEEKVKSQKLVNSIYSLLVISVIGLVLALNFGWISKKTPEVKIAQAINESQMELELKPVLKRIAEIEKKAEKEMLSEKERSEMTNLLNEAERIRKKYEPEKNSQKTPSTTRQATTAEPKNWGVPNCDAGDVWINAGNPSAKINLQMDCWSQLIHLPPNTKVDISVSEELHGVKFWTGETWSREKILAVIKKNDGWAGKVRHKNFRLRGKGEAVITLEKT